MAYSYWWLSSRSFNSMVPDAPSEEDDVMLLDTARWTTDGKEVFMKYGQPAPEATKRTMVREQILESIMQALKLCEKDIKDMALRRSALAISSLVANMDVMQRKLEKHAEEAFGDALKRVQELVRPLFLSSTSDITGLQFLTHAMAISELETMILGSACMYMIARSFEQLKDLRPTVVRAHFSGIIAILLSPNRVVMVQPGPVMSALLDAEPEADARLDLVDSAKGLWRGHVRAWAGSLLRQCEYVFYGQRTHLYYALLASKGKSKRETYAMPTIDVEGLYDEFIRMPETFSSVYAACMITNFDEINTPVQDEEQNLQECSSESSCSASTTGNAHSPTTSKCRSYPCGIRRSLQTSRTTL
jgi:hypothetical protein